MVAAFGIGSTICNFIFFAFAIGLNSALQTLVSQACGAKDLDLCSVYLHRSRLVLVVYFVPSALVLLNASAILKAIGQPESSSDKAQEFINIMLPSYLLTTINDGTRKFLNSLGFS